MAGPFQPLNQTIALPSADNGGADGLVLFNALSTSKTSPVVGIVATPMVLKAYNLQAGESIAVNNYYAETKQSSPYTRAGASVILTPGNTTEVIFLTGMYQLVFTGTLGQLVVTGTPLPQVNLVGADADLISLLRSPVAFPNPLFGPSSSGIVSTKVQVGPTPMVFRAYGLSGSQSIAVLNVFSQNGVDTVFPLSVAGVDATLTATNNQLVLDLSGSYVFQIAAPIEGLVLIGQETAAASLDPYTLYETQAAATAAASSAVGAAASATSASNSATTATTEANTATTQASDAAASATSASNSATTATTEANTATTQASDAAASATSASNSATTATTQAGDASTSATNAAASATSASNSAATATTQASDAAASATSASNSATTATTQASNASTSASAAASSASGASSSASAASSSASGAASSATTATNQAAIATAAANAPRLHPSLSISSSTGVVTIDLSTMTEDYYLLLTENVTSWVFSNPPASGQDAKINVVLTQAATAMTCVSPATAGHTAGTAWTVSSTANSTQWLGLVVTSAGVVTLTPNGVLA